MAKIIFFDIDGTLRGFNEQGIRLSVYKAIERARSRGVRCFVATGRHPLEIEEENLLGNLEFDGFVYLNGSYCVDQNGKILYQTPIDPSQLEILLQLKETEDFSLLLMEADSMYIDRSTEHVMKMQTKVGTRVPPVVPDLYPSLTRTIYQMVVYGENETLDRLMEQLPLCSPTKWFDEGGALDITPAGGSKLKAIEQVLNYYGISASEAAAVGDGYNDVEMLAAMGVGIAMGNGCEEAKRAAKYIAPDIDADGLLWAVERILQE